MKSERTTDWGSGLAGMGGALHAVGLIIALGSTVMDSRTALAVGAALALSGLCLALVSLALEVRSARATVDS